MDATKLKKLKERLLKMVLERRRFLPHRRQFGPRDGTKKMSDRLYKVLSNHIGPKDQHEAIET